MNETSITYFIQPALLCALWAAGLVLALFRIKQAPKTSLLFIAALIVFSLGAFANAYLVYSALNENIYQLLGRTAALLNLYLRYVSPISKVIGWLLLLAAFFPFNRGAPKIDSSDNNPSAPGKWEFSIKFTRKEGH